MAGTAALEKMRESKARKILRRICFCKPEPERAPAGEEMQAKLDQAFIDAAYYGETMKIEPLLNAGADIESKSGGGMTPLMWAAKKGYAETCGRLLEKGADINATDDCGRTPLVFAAIWGRVNACKLLVERGADINIMDDDGQTARMVADFIGRKNAIAYFSRMEKLQGLTGKEKFHPFLSAFSECIAG